MADRHNFKSTPQIKSPICPCAWPKLGTPGTGEFDGEYGSFGVTLILDPENSEHSAFIEKIKQHEQAMAKEVADFKGDKVSELSYHSLIRPEKRKNEDGSKTPTGKLEFKFSQRIKKSRDGGFRNTSVAVVDAQNNLLNKEQKDDIYGGSKIRVLFKVTPYDIGGLKFSKQIIAIQLVEKASSYTEQIATSAFEAVEDGYSVSHDAASTDVPDGPEEDEESNDDF